MRDTRVHLNNFYICGATNQEINVTPFANTGKEEGGGKRAERAAYKIKQMGCGGRRRRVSRHSSEFRYLPRARKRTEEERESLMNNLYCR